MVVWTEKQAKEWKARRERDPKQIKISVPETVITCDKCQEMIATTILTHDKHQK